MNLDRYIQVSVENALRRIRQAGEGERNVMLNAQAYSLGQIVWQGSIDVGAIAEDLVRAALDAGLTEKEARDTVKCGLESGKRRQRTLTPEQSRRLPPAQDPLPQGPIATATRWERKERPQDGQRQELTFSALKSLVQWPAKVESPDSIPQVSFGVFQNNYRAKKNLGMVTAIVIDGDHPDVGLSALPEVLGPVCFVGHTTKRHTADAPRWRAILPLSRPVSAYEHKLLLRWFEKRIRGVDPCPPSQAFYVPVATDNYQHLVNEAPLLDVDELLEEAASLKPKKEQSESEKLRALDARRMCFAACCDPGIAGRLHALPEEFPESAQQALFAWLQAQAAAGNKISALDIQQRSGVSPKYLRDVVTECQHEKLEDAPLWMRRIRSVNDQEVVLQDLRRISRDTSEPVDLELVRFLTRELEAMLQKDDLCHPLSDVTPVVRKLVEDAISGEAPLTIPTGFSEIDDIAAPSPGNVVVVAARTGIGKTTFLAQVVYYLARRGMRVLWFSTEMNNVECLLKLVTVVSEIATWRIVKPRELSEEEIARVDAAMSEINSLPIDFSPSSSPDAIVSMAREMRERGELDAFVVDYIQDLSPPACHKRGDTRNNELTATSRMLSRLAHETGMVAFIASQVSRGDRKDRDECPQLGDLRDSGSIGQDANIVYILHREKNSTDVLMRVAKNRLWGRLGDVVRPFEGGVIQP